MSDDATPHPPCPRCRGTHAVRNGRPRSGSPQLPGRGCARRFVPDPTPGPVSDARRELVRRLPRARVSARGVARATGRARSWVRRFVSARFRGETPLEPGPLKKRRAAS